MTRLDGKVCVITGAAGGIRAETAKRFKDSTFLVDGGLSSAYTTPGHA